MKHYTAKQDILSGKRQLYAKKGEQLSQVADNGNVVIVQNAKGDRFAVNKEFLTEKK